MAEGQESETKASVTVHRVQLDVAAPRSAQSFGWVRVGNEVMLEVGYVDFYGVHAATEKIRTGETPDPVAWLVTDRFVMSLETAEKLAKLMAGLATELQKLRSEGEGADVGARE